MSTFYSFRKDGVNYSFDDIFVPADLFRFLSGALWSWGDGASGQLGVDDIISRFTPVTVLSGVNDWRLINAGGSSNLAIKTDGTLWTWGLGTEGRLGVNDTSNRLTPVTTFAGGNDWKTVDIRGGNANAIKTDGTLWVWGSGGSGRLGTNDTTNRLTPVTTFAGGTNWKQVSSGITHRAAIKVDGTLWVWGQGISGQLGTNNTNDCLTPVTTFAGGTNWKQVDCGGESHTAAIKTDGTLWVWGSNLYGQLGTNDTNDSLTPITTFAGGTNWKQVSLSTTDSSYAIKTDGTLWVWGSGISGQLGTNNEIDRSTPVTTFAGGTNWKRVDVRARTAATTKTDGTLWTWGGNNNGKLGTNDTTNRLTPVTTFAGGVDWKQASSSGSHCIATTYGD